MSESKGIIHNTSVLMSVPTVTIKNNIAVMRRMGESDVLTSLLRSLTLPIVTHAKRHIIAVHKMISITNMSLSSISGLVNIVSI